MTKYMPNGSLFDVIESVREFNAPSSWDDTIKLINIYGIASAMAYLHSHKIIHIDLKPQNILMDQNYYPKIIDFGFSKTLHSNVDSISNQSSDGYKGTFLYLAPEIIESYKYDFSCDVYSFALIVYKIITNDVISPTINNANLYIYLPKILNSLRPIFKEDVPESYINLIERCWVKNPEERENRGFITNLVDENEFLSYVDYIDHYSVTFDSTKKIISFENFEKRSNLIFKKLDFLKEKNDQNR